ncbi:ammonia-forming cytochrome c nitrite reductase subunit c552 [Zhaonella formicivorans]|uniref:ammonia-forming cytochrome c nitrite reductase subunit c552 n=1 Tax=Zhaonella formicivorans TaxID=2528593 RepID=UPI0010E86160|nr:ammonia-forming cytochrome c nitrite reductase subunit c552 [Zhaonella formicivorans]
MKKYKLLLGLAALLLVLVAAGCGANNEQAVSFRADIPEGTLSAEEFGKYYPKQFDSYKKNSEMSNQGTKYGGSEEYDKLTQWPFLKELFAGYGFSKEYNEDRGHVYTLTDVKKIKRINEKSIASCWTCKSANVPGLVKEMGDSYYATNFHELTSKMQEPITCANCHDPKTMNLVITQPPLRNTLTRLGKDPDKLSHQEMRTYVCAQCHVEYYFAGDKKVVTFPWDKGFTPDDILAYYEEQNFVDWEHPKAGTGEIKVQHPEFETFQGSVHQAAGLACADCHMPYKMEGGEKISSHWWTSPLKHIEESCMTCHREDPEWLKQRVFYTQDKTANMMAKVGNINVEAIHAIEAAAKAGANPAALEEARKLQRKAQFYIDWVGAENSMGFHNPQLTMESLNKSLDLATQAKLKAIEAQTGVAAPSWQTPAPMTAENAVKAKQEAAGTETGAEKKE